MTDSHVLLEYVSQIRALLRASNDPEVARVGNLGEILYLVNEPVTTVELELLAALVASNASAGPRAPASRRLQAKRDALEPYVGKPLLKTGMQCASRQHEVYVDADTEAIVFLIGFDLPETLPAKLADAKPADQARWIFDHPASDSYAEGQRVVELFLTGRDAADLSSEELLMLAKGYNWWGQNKKALDIAKLGLARAPHSIQWLSLARLYIRNAFLMELPAFLSACNACINEGIGPAAFWHLLKADAFIEIATGESEFEDYEWTSGDPIVHPELLRPAADSLEAALACEPTLREQVDAAGWVGDWNLRFAAVLQGPAFGRLKQ